MNLEEIEIVEKRLAIQLPDAYKEFQLNYPTELIELNFHKEFFINDSNYLIEVNEMFRSGRLPKEYLVIGNDIGGNYFFMNINDLEPLVYYMDHEETSGDEDVEEYTWAEVIEKFFTVDHEDLNQFSKWLIYHWERG